MKDFQADLDELTKLSGFSTVVRSSQSKYAIFICSRGTQRPSTAITNTSSTIKNNCNWKAIAYTTKTISGKWKLVIQKGVYTHHGFQKISEAQRGWVKLLPEHHDFLARTAQDPSLAKPKKLETAFRRKYLEIQIGSNMMKNWLYSFRKQKQSIYTSTQAALEWFEKEDYWYR